MNETLRSHLYEQEKTERMHKALETVSLFDVYDHAAIQPGHKPPDQLNRDYRLVALEMVPAYVNGKRGRACKIPEGVESNYKTAGGTPYLDTTYGIGLVYHDRLGAVSSARIAGKGLLIVQLQGVNTADPNARSSRHGAVRSGLYSGLAWHETLVHVWEHVAREIELPYLDIQSAANNEWKAKIPMERLIAHYDDVADRMSYLYDPETHDWRKQLLASAVGILSTQNHAR